MPKPLLLHRPAGVYVRFLVPADLRGHVGSRFIVRSVHERGDAARLVAAIMGLALSQAFQAIRVGRMVDVKKLLDGLGQGNNLREWTLEGVRLPNGVNIDRLQADGPQDQESLERFIARLGIGGNVPAVAPPTGQPQANSGPLLSKASADYLGDLGRAIKRGELEEKTKTESAHSLRLLAGVLAADKPVGDINTDDIRAFFDAVLIWPKRASQREPYKGKMVQEVLTLVRANPEPPPAAWTVDKHRQRLSAFFNQQIKAGHLSKNPVHGMAGLDKPDPDEDSGRPFTPVELSAIFEPKRFAAWAKKYPHRWFGSMLGLYSGARVNEVGQLEIADVEQVDGVWGFAVRKNREKGKKTKNKPTRRFVPIAKPVLDAGLLDYIEDAKAAGHSRLFPNLPNSTGLGFGRQLSRQFIDYLRNQCGITEEGSGFHYFRHTIASALDGLISPKTLTQITGHKRKSDHDESSVINDFYIKKTLPQRQAALALFKPDVALPAYTRGQFKRALRDAPVEWVRKRDGESS